MIKLSSPSPMALHQGYGGQENKGKTYDLGDSKPGEHEAISPEAFNPESTDGIQREIGEKYISNDYASFPSDPQ